MSDRQKRDKAQDVFNLGTYVFGHKTTFEKAFPEVEECVIEVQESRHGVSAWNQGVSRYTNPGEYINCSNSLCYNGGFNIGSPIREMVRAHKTEKEGNALCQGSEGSPKGRRIYRKCMNFFKYKITIKYRSPKLP
jgi:hypothetical protein